MKYDIPGIKFTQFDNNGIRYTRYDIHNMKDTNITFLVYKVSRKI